MSVKKIIGSNNISALYFVQHPFRSDRNYFCFGLEELQEELNDSKILQYAAKGYTPSIYEVRFYMKKPIFHKLTVADKKRLKLI
jgi:hypothetical protein